MKNKKKGEEVMEGNEVNTDFHNFSVNVLEEQFKEALSSSEREKWKYLILSEIKSFIENCTFYLKTKERKTDWMDFMVN